MDAARSWAVVGVSVVVVDTRVTEDLRNIAVVAEGSRIPPPRVVLQPDLVESYSRMRLAVCTA